MTVGVFDKIGHDQKIPCKPHLEDHREFKLKPVAILGPDGLGEQTFFRLLFGQSPHKPLPGLIGQHVVKALILFRTKYGELILPEAHFIVALFRHPDRIVERVLISFEGLFHLGPGLEIELVRGELEPLFIIHRLACLDAQKHIMGLGILLVQVMAVVGAH